MRTIILPGYSLKNKDWAEEVARELSTNGLQSTVHEWKHWTSGSFSLIFEVNKLLGKIGNGKINILAKSIGTRVFVKLLDKIPSQINKVILCGIPTKENGVYQILQTFPADNIVVFQNTKDPLASFSEIKKIFDKINPKIKVVEKDRSDHSYPYPKDFIKFLS